jgi:two-component system CheB/CheR fusion protein
MKTQTESLLLRSVLNSSPAGIMAFTAIRDDQHAIVDFECLLMNKRATEITGKTEQSMEGASLLKNFTGSRTEGLFQKYVEVVETGKSFHTIRHYKHDKIDHWLDIYVEKVYDGFVITFADITELKNAETALKKLNSELERSVVERTGALNNSEEYLRISLETAELGTWNYSITTNTITCSDRAKEIIGLPVDDDPDLEKLQKCIHSEDLAKLAKVIDAIYNCDTVDVNDVELRMMRMDNSRMIWVKLKWKIYMNEDNCPYRLTGTIMDISQSTEAKEVLRNMLFRKDEFIGIASHELKTPLTSIKGYVQLIKDSVTHQQTQQLPVYVEKAEQNIQKLTHLINDLLDVSKIQEGKLTYNFAEFDVEVMLKESIENVQHTTRSHKIVLKNTVASHYFGDKLRIEQVLNNFLTNAIKYSPNADTVIVNAEKIKNYIVISVKDFGIGIEPENMSKLFDRFYRIDNTSSKFGGLGLGLYISAEIIKRHKGTFWIDSEVGKGSTFYFLLPLDTLPAKTV